MRWAGGQARLAKAGRYRAALELREAQSQSRSGSKKKRTFCLCLVPVGSFSLHRYSIRILPSKERLTTGLLHPIHAVLISHATSKSQKAAPLQQKQDMTSASSRTRAVSSSAIMHVALRSLHLLSSGLIRLFDANSPLGRPLQDSIDQLLGAPNLFPDVMLRHALTTSTQPDQIVRIDLAAVSHDIVSV